jgi:hypothetical protein
VPDDVEVLVISVDLPPGDPGSPPHCHCGPVFGLVTEGALRLRSEGEAEDEDEPQGLAR